MATEQKDSKWIDLFLDIIEKAFLGNEFQHEKQIFRLEPTLVEPSDLYRRTFGASLTSYESLLKSLDPTFKALASGEVYRKRSGWVAQGLRGVNGRRIRRITSGKRIFLLPDLSQQPSIGIDTSGCEDKGSVIVVCSIPDCEGAYVWLEKHLKLPRDHIRNELHWTKLSSPCRKQVLDNFELTLSICCGSVLAIKTNALNDRRGRIEDLFINLIEGCFSGYERDPKQKYLRPSLKRKFFITLNGVPIHCDADFRPLTPDKVVRLIVQTLAKQGADRFEKYTPLFANLRSHESKPIQIADIIAGMIKTQIEDSGSLEPLQPLLFDLRKMKKYSDYPPKAYFWFA